MLSKVKPSAARSSTRTVAVSPVIRALRSTSSPRGAAVKASDGGEQARGMGAWEGQSWQVARSCAVHLARET